MIEAELTISDETPEKSLGLEEEQVSSNEQAYKFLRGIVEENPETSYEQRLLFLGNSLTQTGQYDQAMEVIQEVIDRGIYSYERDEYHAHLQLAEAAKKAGNANLSKKHLDIAIGIVREGIRDNEGLFDLARELMNFGFKDSAKDLLLEVSSRFRDLKHIDTIRLWQSTAYFLHREGYIDDLRDELQRHQQRIEAYLTDDEQEDSDPQLYIDACTQVAGFMAQIEPESPQIKVYVQKAIKAVKDLPDNWGEEWPYPVKKWIAGAARAGFPELTSTFVGLLAEKEKRGGILNIAEQLAKNDDRERARHYYTKAEKHPFNPYDTHALESELTVLAAIDPENISIVLDKVIESYEVLSQNRNAAPERFIENVARSLVELGYIQETIDFFRHKFLEKYYLGQQTISIMINSLGKHLPGDMLLIALSHLNPEDRVSVLFNNFSLSRSSYNPEILTPFLTGSPEALDFRSLQPYVIQMMDHESWIKLQAQLKNVDGLNRDELIDRIKFLLLEFASLRDIEVFFDVISPLKEKISIDRIDTYRALVHSSHIRLILGSSRDRSTVNRLVEHDVLTESKHLFYVDTESLKRIDVILDEAESNELGLVIKFLSRVFKSKTSHVSSIVFCVQELSLNLAAPDVQDDIVEAIDSMGAITPTLFDRYRKLSAEERPEFITAIHKLREIFYKNTPINPESTGLPEDGFDELLAEYISILFKPVNMSPEKILYFIRQLRFYAGERDLTAELGQRIKFSGEYWNEELGCYLVDIPLEDLSYQWIEGQKGLSTTTLTIAEMMTRNLTEVYAAEPLTQDRLKRSSLVSLLKRGNTIQPQESKLKMKINEEKVPLLTGLLSFLTIDDVAIPQEFIESITSGDPTETYMALSKMKEFVGEEGKGGHVTGILIADQWKNGIRQWLENTDEQLAGDVKRAAGLENSDELVDHLYQAFEKFILPKITSLLAKEEKKLESTGVEGDSGRTKRIRFYPSKNIPSFFAKAAAGICTSEDINLYTSPDHFHLNPVDDETEEIIGNVQQYVIKLRGGSTTLMSRGVNPTVRFIRPGNVRGFTEGAVMVGREMAQESGFGSASLSESLGGWHADSNRPEVATLIRSEYLLPKKEFRLPEEFAITGGTKIEKIYLTWQREKMLDKNARIIDKLPNFQKLWSRVRMIFQGSPQ